MTRKLPEYKQRIAGKSIPFEKFSIHKANKYLEQNHRLFLPGMELILVWNGFKVLHRTPDLVEPMLKLVQKSLVELEWNQRCEGPGFRISTWLLSHAQKLASFILEEGDLDQAKEFLITARKDYESHMLTSRLHFRIHSALQEIKHRRKQAKEASKTGKTAR
ncbi:Tetratricopeptide repeat protein 39B [Desmophyllum pertusum]|uniref:Tetratricopeptide repeat protein 39B n=1 Tax=Desmophyllum pertusum TaxID=174260 RepID=A0A9W9ZVT9_9CNID|nr:Tetratricopeptide repeat protein 39B [Desmophyllum pertusum]